MTLTFHWFLPTNGGDGRQVLAGGHVLDAAHADPAAYDAWLETAVPLVHALAGRPTPTTGAAS